MKPSAARSFPVLAFVFMSAACGDKADPAGSSSDAAVATADAPLAVADAPAAATPDAPLSGTPDAPAAATPDAPLAATPDAPAAATPDAPAAVTPDAPLAVPDAPTPDAPTPDAPAPIDAAAADAGGGEGCLPQCYIDNTTPLVSQCIPSGACKSNFNIGTKTLTICYANGVKMSTVINGTNADVIVKKTNGDTCYKLINTAPTSNSTRTLWQTPASVTVAQIDVPDVMGGSNKQDYTCFPGGGPYHVDVSLCPTAMADAGGSGGCTNDPTCVP